MAILAGNNRIDVRQPPSHAASEPGMGVWTKIEGSPPRLHVYMAQPPVNGDASASFEEAMAELDKLVAQMESGQLPLEASIAAYQRGSELIKFCAARLDRVENQVKVLEGDMLKPFAGEGVQSGAEE